MHALIRKKLRLFNPEYNCDICCLKGECQNEKEYCAVKYDTVEVIHHRKQPKQQPEPAVEQQPAEKQEQTQTDIPSSLCGQGRCMECPRTLC